MRKRRARQQEPGSQTSKKPSVPDANGTTVVPVSPKPGLVRRLDAGADGMSVIVNEDLAQKAFGTDDDGFIQGAMDQIIQMTANSSVIDKRALDFAGAALVGIAPKTALEAMLAVQIVANHICTMKLARQLATASTIERQQAIGNLYAKAARTFPAQLETLHRMRHGGQQKVTVEHVNVADGGQAVFGNIDAGGRG